jgi:hypothetical protein
MQKGRAKALVIRLPPEEDFNKKNDDFYKYREQSMEERQARRGWNEGLRHLQSKNFVDFMEMETKPAFGIPTVHYTNKIQNDPKQDLSEHSKILWGMIAKNLLVEGAMEGKKPRLV